MSFLVFALGEMFLLALWRALWLQRELRYHKIISDLWFRELTSDQLAELKKMLGKEEKP